jgi:hypothetical protein
VYTPLKVSKIMKKKLFTLSKLLNTKQYREVSSKITLNNLNFSFQKIKI